MSFEGCGRPETEGAMSKTQTTKHRGSMRAVSSGELKLFEHQVLRGQSDKTVSAAGMRQICTFNQAENQNPPPKLTTYQPQNKSWVAHASPLLA
jgi:hypothetical protein